MTITTNSSTEGAPVLAIDDRPPAGRSGHAIEPDPAYVDVAVSRWQAFVGETARLDWDGRSFAELSAERFGKQDDRMLPDASDERSAP